MDEVTVGADRLRELFNAGRFNERCLDGELTEWIVYDEEPAAGVDEPPGTRSQLVDYLDGGVRVARIHQYLRHDGSLGGSGLPDPKLVVFQGVIYRLAPRSQLGRPRTRRG